MDANNLVCEPTGLRQQTLPHEPAHARRWPGMSLSIHAALSRHNGFLRQALLLSSGTFASHVILLASGVILARIYEPEQFGVLSIFVSMVTLLCVMAAWRYEVAIPLPEHGEEAVELFALSLVSLIVMTLCSVALVWTCGPWLVVLWPDVGLLKTCLWLVPLAMFFSGLHRICSSWLVRDGNFREIASNGVIQTLLQVLSQIVIGLVSGSTIGLISGDLVGRSGGALSLWHRCWKNCREPLRGVQLHRLPVVARRYWRFPVVSSGAALMNAGANYLPHILIAIYFGLGVAGLFALAQRIITMPCTLLANSVGKVFFRECARLRFENPVELETLFWRTVVNQGITAAAVIALMVAPAPWYFGWIFGGGWVEAGWYAWPLALVLFARFIALPLGATLDVYERQDLHILREVIRVVGVAIAIIVSATLQVTPIAAITLFSVAAFFANGIGVIIVWGVIHREAVLHGQ